VHFFKPFSTDSKSAWNSAFFYTHIEFLKKKNFLALISTFLKLWLQMRRKRLKKTENLILWMCLRIQLCNHQRVCITKLQKSLYPNTHSIPTGKLEARKFFLSYFKGPSSQDQQKTLRSHLITFKVTLTGQSHFMLIFVLHKGTLRSHINSVPWMYTVTPTPYNECTEFSKRIFWTHCVHSWYGVGVTA
jgi:hypothetical protein